MATDDDTITIDCVESHATRVFRAELLVMKERRLWTDFLINVNSTSLPCHRNIVCSNSRMIRDLLYDEGMAEAAKYAINLNHLNVTTMERVLDFMYSGKITFHGADLKEYLKVAVELKMDILTARCLEHVPSRITNQNALGWFKLGYQRELPELIEHAAQVIIKDFPKVTMEPEFLALERPHMERCLKDALQADAQVDRDDVLRAVIQWVGHIEDTRVAHLEELVTLVQPDKCSPDALFNIIQTQSRMICQSPNVLVSMTAAMHRNYTPAGETQMVNEERQQHIPDRNVDEPKREEPTEQIRDEQDAERLEHAAVGQIEGVNQTPTMTQKEHNPLNQAAGVTAIDEKITGKQQDTSSTNHAQKNKGVLTIIGSDVNDNPSPIVWVLDEDSQQFIQSFVIPEDELAERHSVSKTDDGFVLTGGVGSDICIQYSVHSKNWTKQKNMLEERCLHGSFFTKGVLYVIGGYVKESKSKSIHRLAIADGDWHHTMDLPIAVSFPKLADLNDITYLLDQDTRHLIRIDTEKKTCVELAPLPGEGTRYGVCMTTVNRKLCVAGGAQRICTMYEPDTDTCVRSRGRTNGILMARSSSIKTNFCCLGGNGNITNMMKMMTKMMTIIMTMVMTRMMLTMMARMMSKTMTRMMSKMMSMMKLISKAQMMWRSSTLMRGNGQCLRSECPVSHSAATLAFCWTCNNRSRF